MKECLFNDAAAFLSGYSSLLRADLDTFPTPGGDDHIDDHDDDDDDSDDHDNHHYDDDGY